MMCWQSQRERGRGGSCSQTSNLNRTLKSDSLAAHAETPRLHKGKQIGKECKRNMRGKGPGLVVIVPTAEHHQGVSWKRVFRPVMCKIILESTTGQA